MRRSRVLWEREKGGQVKPENRKPVERTPEGKVKAGGGSLNPGGRPKGYADFREACRERSPRALATLEAALDDEKLKVQAALAIISYGYGKPPSAPEDLEAVAGGAQAPKDLVIKALRKLAGDAD